MLCVNKGPERPCSLSSPQGDVTALDTRAHPQRKDADCKQRVGARSPRMSLTLNAPPSLSLALGSARLKFCLSARSISAGSAPARVRANPQQRPQGDGGPPGSDRGCRRAARRNKATDIRGAVCLRLCRRSTSAASSHSSQHGSAMAWAHTAALTLSLVSCDVRLFSSSATCLQWGTGTGGTQPRSSCDSSRRVSLTRPVRRLRMEGGPALSIASHAP